MYTNYIIYNINKILKLGVATPPPLNEAQLIHNTINIDAGTRENTSTQCARERDPLVTFKLTQEWSTIIQQST